MSAQSPTATVEDQKAREIFLKGETAYQNGEFEQALQHFQSSYALSKRPLLLYNIGQSADRLRKDEIAIEAFESYLRDGNPSAEQRKKVEVRLRAMRNAQKETRVERTVDVTDEVQKRATESEESPKHVEHTAKGLGLGLLIGGATLTVGGGVLLGLGVSNTTFYNNINKGTEWQVAEPYFKRGRWMTPAGIAIAGMGLITAVVGIVLLLKKKRKPMAISIQTNSLKVNF